MSAWGVRVQRRLGSRIEDVGWGNAHDCGKKSNMVGSPMAEVSQEPQGSLFLQTKRTTPHLRLRNPSMKRVSCRPPWATRCCRHWSRKSRACSRRREPSLLRRIPQENDAPPTPSSARCRQAREVSRSILGFIKFAVDKERVVAVQESSAPYTKFCAFSL